MSDELRQLATAIVALAESNQGIGGALREQIAIHVEADKRSAAAQGETNAFLAKISHQNAQILEQLEMSAERHRDSEREIRVVKSIATNNANRLDEHDAHIVQIKESLGELLASKAG